MGNKIITEKDFFMCVHGAMPAPFQGTRASTKKKDDSVYITVADTATSSWIDFGCTKNMLWNALITAVVVVVAVVVVTVLVVGTGGLALGPLMMIGAAAATFAGAVTAVEGALKCGQKNATAREWIGGKSDFISQGIQTVTGDMQMSCKIGGGPVITFAPQVKSWTGAIALGGLNYITKLAECALGGAAVGAAGYLAPSLAGGQVAFALPTMGSVATNVATGFTGVWGASRVLFGLDGVANEYAMGNVDGLGNGLMTFGNGAIPEVGMAGRIVTGKPEPSDFLLFAYLLNFKAGKNSTSVKSEENAANKVDDEVNNLANKGDKDGQPSVKNKNKKGEAFEAIDKELRNLVKADAEELSKLPKEERGPVVARAKDTTTGKISDAYTNVDKMPENLDPILKERVKSLNESGNKNHYSEPGTHAEVLATDELLKARRNAGENVTHETLNEIVTDQYWLDAKAGAPNGGVNPAPTCGNCTEILNGTTSQAGTK